LIANKYKIRENEQLWLCMPTSKLINTTDIAHHINTLIFVIT